MPDERDAELQKWIDGFAANYERQIAQLRSENKLMRETLFQIASIAGQSLTRGTTPVPCDEDTTDDA